MTPNDPLYVSQWHFDSLGLYNGQRAIESVWDEFNGAGVHVGIYDSGIDLSHPDLAGNYDASRNIVIGGATRSGGVNDASSVPQSHGTAVAGLIAASGSNSQGGIGVAWGASLTSVNIFDSTLPEYVNADDPTAFFEAMHQQANFDIASHSWGWAPAYLAGQNLTDPASFDSRAAAEYEHAADTGRGGLGAVVVQAAGNADLNANADGMNVSRFTATVSAVLQDGSVAFYSNYGVCVLVCAPGSGKPGSVVTTDRSGAAGYDPGDYTSIFNGTSAATPMVSGVVGLMLDANAGLGWRDAQSILGASAVHTGSSLSAAAPGVNEHALWEINGADDWNGGGAHYAEDYGYGLVNVFNAVRMAEAWSYFSPAAQTSANEQSVTTGALSPNLSVAPGTTASYQFTVGGALEIEHVALTLDIATTAVQPLAFTLTSPDGTAMRVHDGSVGLPAGPDRLNWTYGIDGLHGELATGQWTLTVQNAGTGTPTVNGLNLTAYGTTATTDDVYHYTDEFSDMLALDGGRSTLADADGGSDWIDAAAVHAGTFIDLAGGGGTIDGQSVTVSGIENVIGGDGDNYFIGGGDGNHLLGMRGADILFGGAGADTLDGGAGLFDMASFADRSLAVTVALSASGAAVALVGGVAEDILRNVEGLEGGAFGDRLSGNARDNTLLGEEGADTLWGGNGGFDSLLAGRGIDTADFSAASGAVSLNLTVGALGDPLPTFLIGSAVAGEESGVENVTGGAFGDTLTGGVEANVLKGLGGTDSLVGANGADSLDGGVGVDTMIGGAGVDTMSGGAGDDTYVVDTAGDIVIEASNAQGAGYDKVESSITYVLTTNVEQLTLTGAGPINGFGNDLTNILIGNGAANLLNGIVGADSMTGGGGSDTYVVDNVGEKIFELAGGGTADLIQSSVSFACATEVEKLTLTGSVATTAAGNALANILTGNNIANTLNGGTLADTMIGASGNDTYIVDNAGDVVTELAGGGTADEVRSNVTYTLSAQVERLTLTGTSSIIGTGNTLANTMVGNTASNLLDGGLGNDTLTTGTGNDAVLFSTALGAGNVNAVTDFNVPTDTIRLENAVFTTLPVGVLNANAFVIGAAAADSSDRIVYNSASGALFYDSDGVGGIAEVQFTTLSTGLAMTNADFQVV